MRRFCRIALYVAISIIVSLLVEEYGSLAVAFAMGIAVTTILMSIAIYIDDKAAAEKSRGGRRNV